MPGALVSVIQGSLQSVVGVEPVLCFLVSALFAVSYFAIGSVLIVVEVSVKGLDLLAPITAALVGEREQVALCCELWCWYKSHVLFSFWGRKITEPCILLM